MPENPLVVMFLFICVGPLLLTGFGFWLGRGGPLPGGRRFRVGFERGRYDEYESYDH